VQAFPPTAPKQRPLYQNVTRYGWASTSATATAAPPGPAEAAIRSYAPAVSVARHVSASVPA